MVPLIPGQMGRPGTARHGPAWVKRARHGMARTGTLSTRAVPGWHARRHDRNSFVRARVRMLVVS